LNLSFAGVDGDALLTGLKDVAVSSGAACASATTFRKPSHVLQAIGRSDELARASIRFGLSRFNTEAEIDEAIEKVASLVSRLRGGSAFDELVLDTENSASEPWP
jgi:cysteine desulfurase